ncbi:Transcriptional regulatory protein ZraR [compost metagenome]
MYAWPGNVRELQRVIERAVALATSDSIELDDLPPHVRGEFADILWPSAAAGDSLRTWGSRYVRLVFERSGRNKRLACRVLQISYHTLTAYLRFGEGGEDVPAAADASGWVQSATEPVAAETAME